MKLAPFKVGQRRLLKLAAFLEKLPRKRFYYGSWVGEDWKGKADLSCGTTACALGWATTIPEFRKLGLRLRPLALAEEPAQGVVSLASQKASEVDRDDDPILAALKVFGLSEDETDYLFQPRRMLGWSMLPESPNEYATAKQVAKHIRRFVAYRAKHPPEAL